MDYLASFTLLPLRFAGNQLIENVGSPDGIVDRASLLYRLDIYKPESYQSGIFTVHESLRGREAPAYVAGGITFSEGCNFDLSEFVWGLLSASPPKASQDTITIQALATMPYYVKSWVSPYQGLTETTSGIQYLLRAKLNEEQFAAWKENFFNTYLQEKRSFLTWQPNTNKVVDRTQPEFLSFLVHHSPAPTALKVRVDVEYTDGTRTTDTLTPIELTTVNNYSLYTIPVGFEALGLDELEEAEEKEVFAYTVWLSDQNTQQLTEERRFIVNNDYQPYVRHLVFLNSLGGWDTIRLFGVSKEQLQVTSTIFQRQLEANYTPSSDELFVTNITGERRITLNTGYQPNREWLQYLEEILWSEKVYVSADEGLIPLILAQNTFDSPDDEEDFAGRTFVFKRSKTGKGYSALPTAPIFNNAARPTAWVGVGGYCLVNENGIRTGMQSFSILELRYTDGLFERVPGIARKPNTPDTEGYIIPLSNGGCATTPYLNTMISAASSYIRNDCGVGYSGQAPIITINAGAFGSEVSQLEAQVRAQAAWDALNTQAYANLAGSCVLNFQSAAFSRLSTFNRNNCSGTDFGGKWTISIAANAYTSSVSQAAADALASAAADALDTQANANANGSCVAGYLYTKSVTSGKANYRFIVNSGGWYVSGFGVYLAANTNTDFEVTPPGSGLQMGYNYFGSTSPTKSYNYQVYKNGTLIDSGSGTVPTDYPTSPRTVMNLPTCAAGDMIWIRFY